MVYSGKTNKAPKLKRSIGAERRWLFPGKGEETWLPHVPQTKRLLLSGRRRQIDGCSQGKAGNKTNGVPKGKGMEQWGLPTKCTYGIKYPSMKIATAAV